MTALQWGGSRQQSQQSRRGARGEKTPRTAILTSWWTIPKVTGSIYSRSGFVLRQIWVRPGDWPRVRRYLEALDRPASR